MTGWQDSFQPSEAAQPAVASGGWQSSFQPSETAAQNSGDNRYLADEPGYEYGNMIPFKKNIATGEKSFAVPEAIRSPVRGMQDMQMAAQNQSTEMTPDAVNAALSIAALPQLRFGMGSEIAPPNLPGILTDESSTGFSPNNQPNSGGFLGNNQSGLFPTPPAPSAGAGAQEKLQAALEGAQQQTRFSGRSNALEAGQNANEAISHQYGIDKSLQQQHYDDLNTIGSSFSMPANEVYGKGNQLINSLKEQVSTDSFENKALGDLSDTMESLQGKYGKEAIPDKTAQLPSWKQPMVIQKGEPGQEAYGMQPSDAVDIKTTLNQLARSGRFTNSGQARILEFKNYIQGFLDKASNLSPEFGAQLDKAESQAARVGMYRDPKLSGLWQPKPDYMSYKGETETPAATFDRQANFMSKLNAGSPAAGESYSLAQILPHEQVQEIFRNALLQNKQPPEGVWQNLKTIGGATRWAGTSPDSPLLTLADQLKNMK